MTTEFNCIGTMSGTSLDGLDLALCSFKLVDNKWNFKIRYTHTYKYNTIWKNQLSEADKLSGLELMFLHNKFGDYTAEKVNEFLSEKNEKIDFIASHGHTIFHQPEKGFTLQIGNGANISAKTGITTICDFRATDVAMGGQGAPLVPIGDKLLFTEFGSCLNLGGFANISYNNNNDVRIAYDICPVNILINYLVEPLGLEFDKNGAKAKEGIANQELLNKLNNLPFYSEPGPKSLGKEWLLNEVIPLLQQYNIPTVDKIRTVYEHIAEIISSILNTSTQGKVLITGGGAHNGYLIDLLKAKTKNTIEIPDKELIDYKEALIFAFLGVLRYTVSINCLQSVTGARKDNIGGAIYLAK